MRMNDDTIYRIETGKSACIEEGFVVEFSIDLGIKERQPDSEEEETTMHSPGAASSSYVE